MKDKSIKLKSGKMRGIFSITKKEVLTPKTYSITLEGQESQGFEACRIGYFLKFKKYSDETIEKTGKTTLKAKFIVKDIEVAENKVQLELSIKDEKDSRIEILNDISSEDKVCIAVKSIMHKEKMKHHSLKHKLHAPHKSKIELIHGEYDPHFEKHMKKYELKKKGHGKNCKSESKHGKNKHHHSHH